MNTALFNIVKRIIAEQGENILADPPRLKPLFADYAKNEAKETRTAFGRCLEAGAYTELKKARTAHERKRVKAALADTVHTKTGIDTALCAETLDTLEAAIGMPRQNPPANTPTIAPGIKPASISAKTIIFGIAGALGGFVGECVGEFFNLNGQEHRTFFSNIIDVAVWAAFIGLGISTGLLIAQSIYLKKKPVMSSLFKTATAGIALGAAAGALAQVLFAFTSGISVIVEIISRVFCWGILGWGVGWGVSHFVPNYPKKRAMTAGFMGGIIGGAVFRATFFLPGELSRIAGVSILGLCIGLVISYIEEALREAWLTVIWAKNETKTISLGQKPVIFGSSREADIYLSGDTELPVRATVQIEGGKIVMYDKKVNQQKELYNGDRIDLGRLSFIVNTKKA